MTMPTNKRRKNKTRDKSRNEFEEEATAANSG